MDSRDEKSKTVHHNRVSDRGSSYKHRDRDSKDYAKPYNRDYNNRSGGHSYRGYNRYEDERVSRSYQLKRTHSRDRDRNHGNSRRESPERARQTPRNGSREFRDKSNDRGQSSTCDSKSRVSAPPTSKELGGTGVDDEEDEDLKPVSLKISCPAASTLVKQIEKRKLLFSKKDKPVEATSSSVWQQTTFSDDSDGKVSAKFKRLMGMKDEGQPAAVVPSSTSKPSVTGTQSKDFFVNLEKQYEVARTITHTQRGVGLGFSSGGGSLLKSNIISHNSKQH